MSDNPFQPLPGASSEASAGEPSVSAGEIAAAAAAAAVRGQEPAPTPTLASEEAQYVQESVQAQPESQLPNPQTVPTEVLPTQPFASDAYSQLRDIGIDLPISPESVPQEFADTYNLLAQKILDTHQVASQSMTTAKVAQDQINNLQQSLSTAEGQERLILSLALSNPDNFSQTMDIVQRMQNEPEYAEAQRMRLESMARVEQAERMQNAYNSTQAQTKGQQVEGRVERIATQKGLDIGIAKQMVANKILQNESVTGVRDISFAEVDDIMQQLSRAMNSQKVMTPTQAQAVSQAPQTPASSVGQTPVAQTQAPQAPTPPPAGSQTTPNSDAMDALRAAVRASATNARNSGL